MEGEVGFEPTNDGFKSRSLRPDLTIPLISGAHGRIRIFTLRLLRPSSLPIGVHGRNSLFLLQKWSEWTGSNRQAVWQRILSPLGLPISPHSVKLNT